MPSTFFPIGSSTPRRPSPPLPRSATSCRWCTKRPRPPGRGQWFLDPQPFFPYRTPNPGAPPTAVATVRDELQVVYEEAEAARRTTLTPPRWPALPQPLDIETASTPGGDHRTSRAL